MIDDHCQVDDLEYLISCQIVFNVNEAYLLQDRQIVLDGSILCELAAQLELLFRDDWCLFARDCLLLELFSDQRCQQNKYSEVSYSIVRNIQEL